MKVSLDQIKASSTLLRYREDAASLDARLHEGSGTDDFRFPAGLEADLQHYRAGLDVVFEGGLRGEAEGTCGRCLETYRFPFEAPLRVVLAPRSTAGDGEGDDDLGLGFFEGEEIDVTGLVVEHAMLALPTIPICRDECLGLCPQCGVNRNLRECACATQARPPIGGLAALAGLKVTHARGGS